MKKWKEGTFWVWQKPATLLLFRSQEDFKDWVEVSGRGGGGGGAKAGAKRQQKHCTAFLHNDQPSARRYGPPRSLILEPIPFREGESLPGKAVRRFPQRALPPDVPWFQRDPCEEQGVRQEDHPLPVQGGEDNGLRSQHSGGVRVREAGCYHGTTAFRRDHDQRWEERGRSSRRCNEPTPSDSGGRVQRGHVHVTVCSFSWWGGGE